MTRTDEAWVAVIYLLFVGLMVGGWIANIVKLVGAINDPITAMFILRCVGIPAGPLGVILGFL